MYRGINMIEHRFNVKTVSPMDSLPRITEYFHSVINSTDYYYSCGDFRQSHTHCIFHYTLRGSGMTWIGDRDYYTKPDVGFLNIVNDENCGYKYADNSKEEWEFIVICFDKGNTRQIVKEMLDTYGPLYAIPRDNEVISEIINLYTMSPEGSLTKNESYQLFSRLIGALIDSKDNDRPGQSDRLVSEAEKYIEEKLDEYPTVNSVSYALNVSREHLSRSFRALTGISMKNYIASRQLSRICQLLTANKLSCDAVAEKMHFSSGSNLIQFFKKHTGMTPKEYRKRGIEPFFSLE